MNEISGRVLLADDEQTFAYTTSRVLQRNGLDCDWVVSADEALRAMAERDYDVVVADIKMPGNDSLALFEALRRRDEAPAVILVTGYPSVETAVRSIELGAFAYLVKPFDLQDLVQRVRDALRRTGLRRKLMRRSSLLSDLEERLQLLRQELDGCGSRSLDQTAGDYLNLLLINVGDTVVEAMEVLEVMEHPEKNRPLRELSSHPELEVLRNAVKETVAVLEHTRRNFKSKELAALRQRLSRLLELTGEHADEAGTGG